MEIIINASITYLNFLTSWWWILFGTISVILIISYVLIEDDRSLETMRAIQLSFVGILGIFPLVKNQIPLILRLDFKTRWLILADEKFTQVLLVLGVFSILLGPILLIFTIGEMLFNYFTKSFFALDIKRYGLKEALYLYKYRKKA